MTEMVVTTSGVGLICPYCRFALKQDMHVEECERCHTLHHLECWADGHGCATVGCGVVASGDVASAAPPNAVKPTAPAATAPAPAAAPQPAGGRGLVIGLVCGLLIAAAGVGGYLLAAGGDEQPDTQAPAAAAPAAAADDAEPPPVADEPTREEIEADVVPRIERIIEFSRQGRTAVQQGRYQDAIDNRVEVLARLDAVPAAPGPLGRAQRKLRQAMQASLRADRNYAAGLDASSHDALATQRKQEFVDLWNPVAAAHGATTYSDGEF